MELISGRNAFITPDIADDLAARYLAPAFPDFGEYSKLEVNGEPIWARNSLATTPADVDILAATPSKTGGNHAKANELGAFYMLIMGMKITIGSASTIQDHLELQNVLMNTFFNFRINQKDRITRIPMFSLADGLHINFFSNITAAATEHIATAGGPGELVYQCLIPYNPSAVVEGNVQVNTSVLTSVTAAYLLTLELYGPRWYKPTN